MKIALVTNNNGIGLQTDAELLCQWLVERDHGVTVIQYDQPMPTESYDLGICLEVVNFPPNAKRLWYFANPEWLLPRYVRVIQHNFQKVLAKTHDAERSLRSRFTGVQYVGYLSRDRRDLSIPRQPRFLHLGGNSGFRNTPAVIEAWRSYRYWDGNSPSAPLTVVSNSKMVAFESTPDVTFIKRATDEEITRLQNSHLFHLMPSAYEGYGQALHESQSVGAIILTVGEGPTAELKAPFEIPSLSRKPNNFGVIREVYPHSIRETVPKMLAQPNTVIARMQIESRMRWERGQQEFTDVMEDLLAPKVSHALPHLALLGNFDAPYSTENDLLWTLRDMGHIVTPFQENRDRTESILDDCRRLNVKLLIYVHTHGWTTPGTITLDDLITELRSSGIKTCSFHLDRYWGLNALDKREDRIGLHPFWRTDAIFTADGGNQDKFNSRLGDHRHRWLPPAVVKRDCVMGERREELVADVGFVGAASYHPEYPFRGELLEFLRQVYGDRFRVFQGYRGEKLNDLYASIRVVIGDSCFAGSDYYWSDRVPESLGRGAFLVHPATKGLQIPGLTTFEPANLHDLQDRIDWFLDHEDERQACIKVASAWVKEHETYSNRMSVLLRTMGI